MASRLRLLPLLRSSLRPRTPRQPLSTSAARFQEAAPAPTRKPAGAFRSGLMGFLLGATLAGSGMYYYVVNEYRISNELLTEDLFHLQANVQRIEGYVKALEDRLAQAGK